MSSTRHAAPWAQRFYEASEFRIAHGRMPSPTARDDQERGLATWLLEQEVLADSAHLARIDQALPGWRRDGFVDDLWWGYAHRVAAFTAHLGRPPKFMSTSEPERKLGRWLLWQAQAVSEGPHRWTGEWRRWLNARVPGWQEAGVLGPQFQPDSRLLVEVSRGRL